MKLLNKIWAKSGLVIAVAIIILTLLNFSDFDKLQILLLFQITILMFHQFEEYVYPGGFQDFFNRYLFKKRLHLTYAGILTVNVIFGWTFYITAALVYKKMIWFSTASVFITLANAIAHIVTAIRFRKYSPGLLTGLFLFVPFVFYFISCMYNEFNAVFLLKSLIVMAAGVIIIPMTIYITGRKFTN